MADGNWPSMVTSRASKLPKTDLLVRFGDQVDTVLNGDYVEIPLACEAELVAEVRARGYEVMRDDQHINLLDGFNLGSLTG